MRYTFLKWITFLLLVITNFGCRTYYNALVDDSSNITFRMPINTSKTDTSTFKENFSNQFSGSYKTGFSPRYKNNFTLKDSVIIGFNIKLIEASEIKSNIEIEERKNTLIFLTKGTSNGVYTHKEKEINGIKFFLQFYRNKNNELDYFVSFESEMTSPRVILGTIRFPSSFDLKEIEKQTIKILSGVKFK